MIQSNLLITSISKKVPLLKSVRLACEKFKPAAKIYGADNDPDCIGRYFVDIFWEMPKLAEIEVSQFIAYCRQHQITYIIPTRDGELSFFAANKKFFIENGIAVMVSDLSSVNICLDKLLFFQQANALGFPVIETAESLDQIDATHYVVKERYGAGSKSVGLGLTKERAERHGLNLKNPIFQPNISGEEVSVDLYVARNGKTKGAVSRIRRLVVDGESRITSTIRNDELESTCSALAEELHLYGHVIFQVIIDTEKRFHIIECNSRFGGASTLSIAMGLESFYWFLLEANGFNLDDYPFQRSPVEKTQIRYAEDLII